MGGGEGGGKGRVARPTIQQRRGLEVTLLLYLSFWDLPVQSLLAPGDSSWSTALVKLGYKHLIPEQPNRCKIRAISSCIESDLGFIISSALLCSVIGLENLRHFLNQTFSRASNSLLGFLIPIGSWYLTLFWLEVVSTLVLVLRHPFLMRFITKEMLDVCRDTSAAEFSRTGLSNQWPKRSRFVNNFFIGKRKVSWMKSAVSKACLQF